MIKGKITKEGKTVTVEVTLTLPGNLAREAESKGLLTPEALESLLRAEIRFLKNSEGLGI